MTTKDQRYSFTKNALVFDVTGKRIVQELGMGDLGYEKIYAIFEPSVKPRDKKFVLIDLGGNELHIVQFFKEKRKIKFRFSGTENYFPFYKGFRILGTLVGAQGNVRLFLPEPAEKEKSVKPVAHHFKNNQRMAAQTMHA